jgi:hypothetical protein
MFERYGPFRAFAFSIPLHKDHDPMPDGEKARHLISPLPNLRAHNKPTIPYLVLHTSNERFFRHHLADCHCLYFPGHDFPTRTFSWLLPTLAFCGPAPPRQRAI